MIYRDRNDIKLVSHKVLFDADLSLKAKGLYCILASQSDGTEVSIDLLAQMSKDGSSATSSAVKELEEKGYLRRTQHKNENGKYCGSEWELVE